MILLTGATGFVGQQLLSKLAKVDKVRCTIRDETKSEELKNKGCEPVFWDLAKDVQPEIVTNVDVVVHAAAELRGTKKNFEANVIGTKNLVEACKKAGVKHLIYLSSILADEIYNNDYGLSKREGEEIIKSSGLKYTILRIGNIYSKNNAKTFGKLLKIVKLFPVLIVFGGVTTHFVRLDDVTDAISAAIKNPKAYNKTYFLVGQKLTFWEFFKLASNKLGKKKLIIRIPILVAKIAFAVYKPISKIIRLPVHPETLIINKEFDSSGAEKDLMFHRSNSDDMSASIC